ncbi:glycosyltransferase [Zhaonella formicivorans]|uniref:glycosyltransferase n=1 Tax=Zhaonella formicivorans TaxID=2528593 RepID=UPI0010D5B1BF|nr:glycosyltransferase [Zhaonella formicivorans]
MQIAVVPAQNEEKRIQTVLINLLSLPLDKIVAVINGSEDQTLERVLAIGNPKIEALYFQEKLGLDVPRAIGAKRALELDADLVLFHDGDMVGHFNNNLLELIEGVKQGLDVALTDCYPVPPQNNALVNELLACRKMLNEKLDWLGQLGLANPSHGPHVLSRKALYTIPLYELAVPPMILAYARLYNLKVGIATQIPHQELGSSIRGVLHAEKIVHTICGDCFEAISFFEGRHRSRKYDGTNFTGYHKDRNFRLLKEIIARDSLEDFVACSLPPFHV